MNYGLYSGDSDDEPGRHDVRDKGSLSDRQEAGYLKFFKMLS